LVLAGDFSDVCANARMGRTGKCVELRFMRPHVHRHGLTVERIFGAVVELVLEKLRAQRVSDSYAFQLLQAGRLKGT
jgi:hypothetical protein